MHPDMFKYVNNHRSGREFASMEHFYEYLFAEYNKDINNSIKNTGNQMDIDVDTEPAVSHTFNPRSTFTVTDKSVPSKVEMESDEDMVTEDINDIDRVAIKRKNDNEQPVLSKRRKIN